jgi:hypothetical protein
MLTSMYTYWTILYGIKSALLYVCFLFVHTIFYFISGACFSVLFKFFFLLCVTMNEAVRRAWKQTEKKKKNKIIRSWWCWRRRYASENEFFDSFNINPKLVDNNSFFLSSHWVFLPPSVSILNPHNLTFRKKLFLVLLVHEIRGISFLTPTNAF